MIRKYETTLKLVNHCLKLSSGKTVDFTATCPAKAVEEIDMRPTFECPAAPYTEYSKTGYFSIQVEEVTDDSDIEELELSDSDYEEIRKYCEDNFDDFEE